MKKLLIIVLIVCICISTSGIVALAELTFGSWDKWDKEFPPWDTKYWIWALKEKMPLEVKLKDNTLLLASHLFFCTDEKCSQRISVLIYSPGNEEIKKYQIPNPKFALVAFPPLPPQGKRLKIIAYEARGNELNFLETWEIVFKNNRHVVLKDTKFKKIFKEWLELQIGMAKKITNKTLDNFLPKLQILNKETFIIGVGVKLSKK